MLKVFLIVIALVSVAWKVSNGVASDPRDPMRLTAQIEGLLQAQGFRVEDIAVGAEPWIAADRDGCRIVIAEVRPQGWNAAMIEKLRDPRSRLDYVFRGAVLSSLPTWRATALYQTTRVLRQIGLSFPWFPLLAVMSSPRCAAAEVRWADVGALR